VCNEEKWFDNNDTRSAWAAWAASAASSAASVCIDFWSMFWPPIWAEATATWYDLDSVRIFCEPIWGRFHKHVTPVTYDQSKITSTVNFEISHIRFYSFWKFLAKFWTLSNFKNFRLVIWKQWRKIKKSISQLLSCTTLPLPAGCVIWVVFQNLLAYSDPAVSYECKVFIKLTPVVSVWKLFCSSHHSLSGKIRCCVCWWQISMPSVIFVGISYIHLG
jgi:hypothetical protein